MGYQKLRSRLLLFFSFLLSSCQHTTSVEKPTIPFMHIIPLNEYYMVRGNREKFSATNDADIKRAKALLLADTDNAVVHSAETLGLIETAKRQDNTRCEKELLLEYFLLRRYALISNDSSGFGKIDVSKHIDYLFKNDYLKYMFRTNLKLGEQMTSIMKNNSCVFLVAGSDLIRLKDVELREHKEFKYFFDNYAGWAYALEVDKDTYSKISQQLDEELAPRLKKAIEDGIKF